jgi:hypothetical protein
MLVSLKDGRNSYVQVEAHRVYPITRHHSPTTTEARIDVPPAVEEFMRYTLTRGRGASMLKRGQRGEAGLMLIHGKRAGQCLPMLEAALEDSHDGIGQDSEPARAILSLLVKWAKDHHRATFFVR